MYSDEPATAEQRLEQLQDIVDYFRADREALESPQWQRLQQMIQLRRSTLLQALINSDDDGTRESRTKGRIQEIDYWLGFMERLEGGEVEALREIEEMELFITRQKVAEQADRQGVER